MSAHGPLTVSVLTSLNMIGDAVDNGRRIARMGQDGEIEWGIARAFTHDGGGFLTGTDDVRDGFVWVSGGNRYTERWWPIAELATGLREGRVSLDYSPS